MPKVRCNFDPNNPACRIYPFGLTGSWPNIVDSWTERRSFWCTDGYRFYQETQTCRARINARNKPWLPNVKCGDTVLIQKGACILPITIIDDGPKKKVNAIMDLHPFAAYFFSLCLGRTWRGCDPDFDVDNVIIVG